MRDDVSPYYTKLVGFPQTSLQMLRNFKAAFDLNLVAGGDFYSEDNLRRLTGGRSIEYRRRDQTDCRVLIDDFRHTEELPEPRQSWHRAIACSLDRRLVPWGGAVIRGQISFAENVARGLDFESTEAIFGTDWTNDTLASTLSLWPQSTHPRGHGWAHYLTGADEFARDATLKFFHDGSLSSCTIVQASKPPYARRGASDRGERDRRAAIEQPQKPFDVLANFKRVFDLNLVSSPEFYTEDNLKLVSGGRTVELIEQPGGVRAWTSDFRETARSGLQASGTPAMQLSLSRTTPASGKIVMHGHISFSENPGAGLNFEDVEAILGLDWFDDPITPRSAGWNAPRATHANGNGRIRYLTNGAGLVRSTMLSLFHDGSLKHCAITQVV